MTKTEQMRQTAEELRAEKAGRDIASFVMKNADSPELRARAAALFGEAEQNVATKKADLGALLGL